MDNILSVYVDNSRKYNEGQLQGGWLKLPVSDEELRAFLKDVVGIDEDHEEFIITDYIMDECLDFLSIDEYSNLEALNLIVKQSSMLYKDELMAAKAYIDYRGNIKDPIEILNVLTQVPDIEFNSYDFPGVEACLDENKESLYGRVCAYNNGLTEILESTNIEHLFDYERYGLEESINDAYLTDEGYLLINETDVELNYFTYEELKENINYDFNFLNHHHISLDEQIKSSDSMKEQNKEAEREDISKEKEESIR